MLESDFLTPNSYERYDEAGFMMIRLAFGIAHLVLAY